MGSLHFTVKRSGGKRDGGTIARKKIDGGTTAREKKRWGIVTNCLLAYLLHACDMEVYIGVFPHKYPSEFSFWYGNSVLWL